MSRMGLGLRPTQPVYTNSPVAAQAAAQQMTLFVGSISAGITDMFLNALFSVSSLLFFMLHLVPLLSLLDMWPVEIVQETVNSPWETARFRIR
jgi:hypothetical protein